MYECKEKFNFSRKTKQAKAEIRPPFEATTKGGARGWALSQLWLFWVAPVIGAAIAGIVYRFLFSEYQLPATQINREDINISKAA